ncbi:MAG TPA: winged helix-turn-helix domain-containing protein [Vicinamibacterales bacterium]|jgi:DNA-binding transcriptional ArsR family regulator|nr:winged helix-turn-helix domain-containing protein [Vicinamibacterales bacterium]
MVAQAQPIDIIDDPGRARAALQPIRLRLLHLLGRPQSAPQLAKQLGMPRQRVLYHLRKLESQHLVEAHEHGSVGRRIDRSYVRTATSYAIAPKTLGGVAVDPRTVADAFSSAYLSAVAARALNDLAALSRAAAARGKRVPTLTLDTEVRFATPADQRRFADDLTAALATLAARYHHPDAVQGRTFRVFACGYPAVPPRAAEPESDRETDMEAT